MIPRPGSIALASTWPAWERQGLPLPHPVIVLAAWPNGNVAVAPVTTKADLCARSVCLGFKNLSSGYPPLFRDPCWICVRDRQGDCIAIAQPEEERLKIGTQSIALLGHRLLTKEDLLRVQQAVHQARR